MEINPKCRSARLVETDPAAHLPSHRADLVDRGCDVDDLQRHVDGVDDYAFLDGELGGLLLRVADVWRAPDPAACAGAASASCITTFSTTFSTAIAAGAAVTILSTTTSTILSTGTSLTTSIIWDVGSLSGFLVAAAQAGGERQRGGEEQYGERAWAPEAQYA